VRLCDGVASNPYLFLPWPVVRPKEVDASSANLGSYDVPFYSMERAMSKYGCGGGLWIGDKFVGRGSFELLTVSRGVIRSVTAESQRGLWGAESSEFQNRIEVTLGKEPIMPHVAAPLRGRLLQRKAIRRCFHHNQQTTPSALTASGHIKAALIRLCIRGLSITASWVRASGPDNTRMSHECSCTTGGLRSASSSRQAKAPLWLRPFRERIAVAAPSLTAVARPHLPGATVPASP